MNKIDLADWLDWLSNSNYQLRFHKFFTHTELMSEIFPYQIILQEMLLQMISPPIQ